MSRFGLGKEVIKTYILLLLLLTSILQSGILWTRQSHGFPLFSLSEIFFNQKPDYTENSDAYFSPFKVVISAGDVSHWIIGKDSKVYNELWQEVKNNYISQILRDDKQPASSSLFSEPEWGRLVIKNAVVFEFPTNIPTEIISWFFKTSAPTFKEPSGIHKIAILPWEDVNNNITLYITDDTRIYKYILPVRSGGINKVRYNEIFNALKQDEKLRQYMVISEIDYGNKGKDPISPDILLYAGAQSASYESYHTIDSTAPEDFKVIDRKNFTETDALAALITAGEKDIYDSGVDSYGGGTVFKNLNNLYRVYSDGLLEYKYTGFTDAVEKSSMSGAFKNAVEFIGKRGDLYSGAQLVLSGVKPYGEDIYEFTFDYTVGEVPVYVDYMSKGRDRMQLNHAVTIRASSRRVTEAWWIVKNFRVDLEDRYNINFNNFLDNTFLDYATLKRDKDFFITDISVYYELKPYFEKQALQPVWVVSAKSGAKYAYPMQKGVDD